MRNLALDPLIDPAKIGHGSEKSGMIVRVFD